MARLHTGDHHQLRSGLGPRRRLPRLLPAADLQPDGSRRAVLLVNAEEVLLSLAQFEQVYDVLATAYCRGVTS